MKKAITNVDLYTRVLDGQNFGDFYYNPETLKAKGIDDQWIEDTLNEAIEALPEKPEYNYKWAEQEGSFSLVNSIGRSVSSFFFATRPGGQRRYYRDIGSDVWITPHLGSAKSRTLSDRGIDPSEVKPCDTE